MTKWSSPTGSSRGRGAVREGYKVVALLLKPNLGLFGLVGRRRVLLPHPGSATGHLVAPGDYHTLQQLWCWLSSRLRRCEVAWCGLQLGHVQRVVRYVELCPQALYRPDLHFEGAFNGPVVITWIGREHDLYSGASSISLVEHCVTFRHDRRLLSLFGFVYNWSTSSWSATKKENRFSLNGNGIMSSFPGRQFNRSTL